MYSNYFLEAIQKIANKQEYFPGTGGNISYKIDPATMTIKSSGRRVSHMEQEDAITLLKYQGVKDFFYTDNLSEEGEYKSNELVLSFVDSSSQGRPSIETGFHAILGKAVIHSHSAFVNIATCSREFKNIIESIFFGSDIFYICVDYAKPGYFLTHKILEKIKNISETPIVFFMKNHGVIVSASSMEEAIFLHEKINFMFREYFSLGEEVYPKSKVQHSLDGFSLSNTLFLNSFILKNINLFKSLNNFILFPDLSVFGDDLVVTKDIALCQSKIIINELTGQIIYNTSKAEAHCIEENLVAFAFIFFYMQENNLTPDFISQEDIVLIRNMEQEKYRRMILL